MARRDTAKLARCHDPASNRWFSRPWVLPPPLDEKAPARQRRGRFSFAHINKVIDTAPLTKAQAHALAEQLLASGGAT